MKEEELEIILENLWQGEIDIAKAQQQILRLFSVVGRSEQLVCYKKCGKTEPYNDICLNCGSSINHDEN